MYLQRRSDGQMSVPTNSTYLNRRSDDQMFVPTSSIATASLHNNDKANYVNNKPLYSTEEGRVGTNPDSLHSSEEVIDANDDNNCIQLKTKPLHPIDENSVSATDNRLKTTSSSSLIANLDDDNSITQVNSDIVSVLKEVCNMPTPDIQLPNESDMKVLGDKTREYLNNLYRSSILRGARNKPFNIGMSS